MVGWGLPSITFGKTLNNINSEVYNQRERYWEQVAYLAELPEDRKNNFIIYHNFCMSSNQGDPLEQ